MQRSGFRNLEWRCPWSVTMKSLIRGTALVPNVRRNTWVRDFPRDNSRLEERALKVSL